MSEEFPGERPRGAERASHATLRGFVDSKSPKGTYDQIACVMYYAQEYSGQSEHSIEEIRKLLIAAKIKPPGKMGTALADCSRRTGYVKNVSRGAWALADHGESRVAIELPEASK